jgi:hypothetical protein
MGSEAAQIEKPVAETGLCRLFWQTATQLALTTKDQYRLDM